MKKPLFTFAALTLLSLNAVASTVFYIGVNNDSNSEFEQEAGGRNDNKYYWHVGDYTSVAATGGGFGENWLGDSTNPSGATTYER